MNTPDTKIWVFPVPAPWGQLTATGNQIMVEADDETEAVEKAKAMLEDERKEFERRRAGH